MKKASFFERLEFSYTVALLQSLLHKQPKGQHATSGAVFSKVTSA